MVGVPPEDWVKTTILYVEGKAKYWWRGTGYNANLLPWPYFCQIIGERFNQTSKYDIISQFHNLKPTGSVEDYVDKFEEMVSEVKRHNPSLTDAYYIRTFIVGLKDYIQHHLQCHNSQACGIIPSILVSQKVGTYSTTS